MVEGTQVPLPGGDGSGMGILRATIDAIEDGILILDEELQITAYNRKFLELWRIPESLMHSADPAAPRHHVMARVEDPKAFMEAILRMRDGSIATSKEITWMQDGRILEQYFIRRNIDSKPAGIVLTIRDITERVRTEAESKAAQETLSLLIEVTSTASEAEDSYSMTSRCLETICKMRGWHIGQAW